MELSLLLIVIGIVLAILVQPSALGIALIVVGLVLLIWPRISAGRSARV